MIIPDVIHGKTNFDKLRIDNKRYPLSRGISLPVEKSVYAFDFETLTHKRQGKRKTLPVMLAFAGVSTSGELIESKVYDGKYRQKIWLEYTFEERKEMLYEIIKLLTQKKLLTSLNFFYNLKYDFGLIVSLMTKQEAEELYYTDRVKIGEYEISVVGSKMFSIMKEKSKGAGKKPERQQWRFFDLAVFTMQSLDKASKDWLGQEGGKTDFDTKEVFNNELMLRDNYKKAKDYCENDVIITAKLGFEVKKHFEAMNIPFSMPISNASLYKAFFAYHYIKPYTKAYKENKKKYIDLEKAKYPTYTGYFNEEKRKESYKDEPYKYDMQKLAWQGYFGGLFEMFKRGYFPNAIGFDYDSMYPSIMVDLPDYRDYLAEPILENRKGFEKAKWAIITAKVWIKDEAKICPFPVRAKIDNKEKIVRPVLKGQEVIMSKQMYNWFVNEYPHFENIEITGGYYLDKKRNVNIPRKPFEFMKDLFNERLDIISKHGKDDKRQNVIKIILNAGYGVTAETVEKSEYEKIDGVLCETENYVQMGRFFRPFFAFHITELSRLKIYKDIFDAKAENKVIGVATDCIFFESDMTDYIMENTSFTPEKILGSLSVEKEGEMLVIGNGMYQFKDAETGKVSKTTRGFSEKDFPDLFDNRFHRIRKIPVVSERPRSWREVAFSYNFTKEKYQQDDIAVFDDEEKICDINMDISRKWQGSFASVGEMFEKQIDSKPLRPEQV